MVGVEGEVVQEEKAEPVALAYAGVTADGVVLIGYPYDEDDVEGGGGIVEELTHDRFHANQSEYDCKQWCRWKSHGNVQLNHLQ